MVLHLLDRLPCARYHVYLDNLFTSVKLLELLRIRGYGATGTCRTNSGVIQELVDIKKASKRKNELPWGTLISMPTKSGLVNQIGWQDSAFALLMSTVEDESKTIILRERKRPKATSSALASRKVFGDQPIKELEIPLPYNNYNHNMGGVDIADQLTGSNSGQRRIKRGGWQAIEQWLLLISLVNSFLIARHSKKEVQSTIDFRSQKDFRIKIIDSLLLMGKDVPGPRKRKIASTNLDLSDIQITGHHQIKRQCRRQCVACKGETIVDRPIRRRPLATLSANSRLARKVTTTLFGCQECNVALCKNSSCFDIYHRSNQN